MIGHNQTVIEEKVPLEEQGSFLKGVKDCLPTVLGYLGIGFAAGVIERTAGLSMLEITLIALFLYAGSAQFIVASMLVAGASLPAMIFAIFFVNLRYLLLSAALSPYFKKLPSWKNAIIGFQLTDETFGVAANYLMNKSYAPERWIFGLNVTAYINWLIANIAGGFFGKWVQQPETFGLDFALSAMFIGLLILQILGRSKYLKDLLVMASTITFTICLSFGFSNGLEVILATILAASLGVVIERWI